MNDSRTPCPMTEAEVSLTDQAICHVIVELEKVQGREFVHDEALEPDAAQRFGLSLQEILGGYSSVTERPNLVPDMPDIEMGATVWKNHPLLLAFYGPSWVYKTDGFQSPLGPVAICCGDDPTESDLIKLSHVALSLLYGSMLSQEGFHVAQAASIVVLQPNGGVHCAYSYPGKRGMEAFSLLYLRKQCPDSAHFPFRTSNEQIRSDLRIVADRAKLSREAKRTPLYSNLPSLLRASMAASKQVYFSKL